MQLDAWIYWKLQVLAHLVYNLLLLVLATKLIEGAYNYFLYPHNHWH